MADSLTVWALLLLETLAPVGWDIILLLSIHCLSDLYTAPSFSSSQRSWTTSISLNKGSHHLANFQTNPFANNRISQLLDDDAIWFIFSQTFLFCSDLHGSQVVFQTRYLKGRLLELKFSPKVYFTVHENLECSVERNRNFCWNNPLIPNVLKTFLQAELKFRGRPTLCAKERAS